MKKVILILLLFFTATVSSFADIKLIVSSGLNKDNMPLDRLKYIPFDEDHEYILFLYDDDYNAMGLTKVYFETYIYDEASEEYEFENTYTVDARSDWYSCFKGVLFTKPGRMKIKVFTDGGDLTLKYISVVEE